MFKPILFLLGALLLLVACNNKKATDSSTNITVSIPPQKYFVEQIAGDLFQVNVMLAPGSSPADYEPTPQQVEALSQAKYYFYVGHLGFEKSWMKRFDKAAPGVEFISCSKGIDLLRGDVAHHHHEDDHGHDHGGTDPHIWTSPENVKTISRNIAATLSADFPEHAASFEENLHHFIARIDTLDNYIRSTITDTIAHSFMIFHPSLSYYARDYHLEQLSIEYEGKSPSTAHMKKMIDQAEEKSINTIFVQTQFETTKANAIAKAIGAKVETVDPLSEDWLNEMYAITRKLEQSFKAE